MTFRSRGWLVVDTRWEEVRHLTFMQCVGNKHWIDEIL
jgi:hypothetical protein